MYSGKFTIFITCNKATKWNKHYLLVYLISSIGLRGFSSYISFNDLGITSDDLGILLLLGKVVFHF